ncbi:hypothetical protein CRYUN_Cryun08bG0012600 [Craigia yunnanensis]
MFACLKVKRREDNNQTFFIKNGGVLLKELVAFSNGRPNPIRHFSEEELLRATNYYDRIVARLDGYQLYIGSLKDLPILVKKYDIDGPWSDFAPYKDIAIGSQMSVHKNVLKVLGCCLETQQSTIVYEFAGTESLFTCISATNVQPLPWKCRLKIAVDLANAIAYLHTAFYTPIIHRDIKCKSVILDQNNVPKLIDFGLCISIPEGQSYVNVTTIVGRTGWMAPEYIYNGQKLTEKVDVYSFGKLLLELLRGRETIYIDILDSETIVEKFSNVVDRRITQRN